MVLSLRRNPVLSHQPEPRINVWIIRTKPIPKARPQKTRCCSRRGALHYKMFAVEEISRIARIERKLLKSGKRTEHGRGPLPPVADHLRGPSIGTDIHSDRVP